MNAALELVQDGALLRQPLLGAVVIGRSRECDVRLGSEAVSRRHAQVVPEANGWAVEDLGSRNGTRLNGIPISGRMRLHDGDRIGIGDAELRFRRDAVNEVQLVPELPTDATVVAVRGSAAVRCEIEPQAALDAVLAVTRVAASTLDMEALSARVLDVVLDLYPQADGGVVLLRAADGDLRPQAVRSRSGADAPLCLSRTLLERVMEQREAILSQDARNDATLAAIESLLALPVRTLMCAPLLGGTGEPLGVIQLHADGSHGTFTHACLDVLVAVANAVGIAVENARLHERLIEQDRLQRSLETAREVQRSLLATELPQVAGYTFFAHEHVADSVGGDYHGFLPLGDGRIAVAIGDVSGKGMPAALLAARLSSEVRAVVTATSDPAAALRQLDRSVAHHAPQGRFITFVLAIVDPVRHTLTMANAGHPPLLHRHAGQVVELRPGRIGVPLGLADRTELCAGAGTVALAPGDVVVAYTDGVSETASPDGEELGVERLKRAVAAAPASDAAAVGAAVLAAIRAFGGDRIQRDDTTLVCFTRLSLADGVGGEPPSAL